MSRLLKFILSIIFLTTYPSGIYAQDFKNILTITGNYSNKKIDEILKDIQMKYPVHFFYKEDWIKNIDISISFAGEPLNTALNRLLDSSGLGYIFYNPAIVIIARTGDIDREFTQNYFVNKRRQQNFLKSNDISYASDYVILGDTSNNSLITEALITGRIVDGQTGDPLSGVQIKIESVDQALSTNSEGQFTALLPVGSHLFTISYVGFETKNYKLKLAGNAAWKIELFPESVQLEEVLIEGSAQGSSVQSMIAGITKLSSRDIKELPAFMGEADVIKSILTMPGVSTTGEGTEGFHVRGGNVDQNLILQDEATLFNSSHALGFFSVFNPDIVKEVNLYKGHIPAQYGGRIASILDVKLKDFNNDKLQVKGGIGFVTGKLSVNAPMFNHKTSLLMGGRITYSDWILKAVEVPSIRNSAASFYDYNIKLNQKIGKNGTLTASVYQSFDKVRFSDDFGFTWRNQTYGLAWNQVFKHDFLNNFNVIYGSLSNTYFQPTGFDSYQLINGISYLKFKEELFVTKITKHNFILGFEGTKYFIAPDKTEPYIKGSNIINQEVTRENGIEFSTFINDEYTINHLFSVSAGIRYNIFESLGPAVVNHYKAGMPISTSSITDSTLYNAGEKTSYYDRLEPRISVKYSPNAVSAVKLSYNRLNQFIQLISNTVAPVPVDLWQVSNSYFHPQEADNYSIGYYRNLRGNMWETGIEVFYRTTKNIPLYKDFANLRLNKHPETEVIEACGRSYGTEYYLRKTRGKLTGWLSYTYSRSMIRTDKIFVENTINNGNWFPTYYDKPLQFNLLMDLVIKRGSNLALNFTYFSGRPVTAPTSRYYYDFYLIPNYAERNNFRIPDYHRLDLSYTIKRNVIRKHRYQDSMTFSIYNLYSRDNAFSVFFRRDNEFNVNAYKLSILGRAFPSITYNFQF